MKITVRFFRLTNQCHHRGTNNSNTKMRFTNYFCHSQKPRIVGNMVVVSQLNTHGVCRIAVEAVIADGTPLIIAIDLNHSVSYVTSSVEANLAGIRAVPDPGRVCRGYF